MSLAHILAALALVYPAAIQQAGAAEFKLAQAQGPSGQTEGELQERPGERARGDRKDQDRGRAQGEERTQQRDRAKGGQEKSVQDRAVQDPREQRGRTPQEQGKTDQGQAPADGKRMGQDRTKRDEQGRDRVQIEEQRREKAPGFNKPQQGGDTRRDQENSKRERALIEPERARGEGERGTASEKNERGRDGRRQGEGDQLKQRDERDRADMEQQRNRDSDVRPGGRPAAERIDRAERPSGRLEDVQKQRQERVEGGRRIIDEPDRRQIVKDGGRSIIRHDETERLRRVTRDFRSNRRTDGVNEHSYARPDGTKVISEVDDNGRLLRRYRRTRDGQLVILIDNQRSYRSDRSGFIVDAPIRLAPLSLRIARDRYIVDYSRASEDDIYDALIAPPLERLERAYSLEEIRWSRVLRERMRRVDLDEINFEFGSWEITRDQMPKLERLAKVLLRVLDRQPDDIFMIEGHTDAVGSDDDNLTLSDRRAEAVATVLTEQFDVPPENLVTQGYGEQHLKVETQDAERINRRVALLRITPLLGRDRVSRR